MEVKNEGQFIAKLKKIQFQGQEIHLDSMNNHILFTNQL